MAIRTKFTVDLSLSENGGEAKELGASPPWRGVNDQLDDGGTWRRKIVGSATDIEIDLNGLANGRLIGIKTTKQIAVKKNSALGEAWLVRPLGTGAMEGIFLVTTDGVTSLFVSNPGTEDAEVTFSIAGIF